MVRGAGLKENSTKKNMEKDEILIILCRACLFLLVFDGKKNIAFKISIYFQPLIIEFF